MSTARIAAAYLSHNDFKNQPLPWSVFLSTALVKYVCACTQSWDFSISEKELERFYSKQTYTHKKIKLRKNPTSLHRSKKEECHSSSVELDAKALHRSTKAETNSMGKPRHLSTVTHFNFTPRIGPDLPICATVLAIKTNHFSSPYFFLTSSS